MSNNVHIVHKSNRKTVQHKHRRKKNGKPTKRSPSQINERLTRPHRSAVPKHTTNARIPNHNQNTQKLRSILRTINHIPTTSHTRKERLRQQPMEHEQRKTKKNLQPNNRRTKPAKLHRELTELHMQKNQHLNKQHNSGTSQPSRNEQHDEENRNPKTHLTQTPHRTSLLDQQQEYTPHLTCGLNRQQKR
jgi:hypothetical protein